MATKTEINNKLKDLGFTCTIDAQGTKKRFTGLSKVTGVISPIDCFNFPEQRTQEQLVKVQKEIAQTFGSLVVHETKKTQTSLVLSVLRVRTLNSDYTTLVLNAQYVKENK